MIWLGEIVIGQIGYYKGQNKAQEQADTFGG